CAPPGACRPEEEWPGDWPLPAAAPVEGLSCAPAASGQANAAATAAAIRVFNVMAISFEVKAWLVRLARLNTAPPVLQNTCLNRRSRYGTYAPANEPLSLPDPGQHFLPAHRAR